MFDERVARIQANIAALKDAVRRLGDLPEAQQLLLAQLHDQEALLAGLQQPLVALAVGETYSHHDTSLMATPSVNHHGAGAIATNESLLREYLLSLIGQCNRLSLADADSSDPTRNAVTLSEIFIRLEVSSRVSLSREEKRDYLPGPTERQRSAVEAIAQFSRLVIVGVPGSGKSTLLNYVCLCLAHANLGDDGWLGNLGKEWRHGCLLPVRVSLRDFAAWLTSRPTPPKFGDVQLLWLWLVQQYGEAIGSLLRQETVAGKAILFFDGLDEVPAESAILVLDLVRQTIESLERAIAHCRIVVSCRLLDYSSLPRRQLPNWRVERLMPFSSHLCEHFIDRWYSILARLNRPMNGDPELLRRRLRAEVRERPALAALAGNPLLLTMLTLLHAYEGRLPEERVRVYEKCVEFLLYRWRSPLGEAPLHERLKLPQWRESDLGRLLDRLGYTAHDRELSGDVGQGSDLPKTVLVETARHFFAPYGEDLDYTRAQEFCGYIGQYSNGLMQQFGPEIYRFPHRTFQEYLAARRLVSDEDWSTEETDFVQRMLKRVDESQRWREVQLLAISHLVVNARQVSPAAQLVEELINQSPRESGAWARDVLLGAEMLVEIGRERLSRLGPCRAELWERTIADLLTCLELRNGNGTSLQTLSERVRAGHVLGRLGDPRFPVSADEWRKAIVERTAEPLDEVWMRSSQVRPYFCYVAVPPAAEITTAALFWIARFPVTVAQLAPFVREGYRGAGRRWWDDDGWQWKNHSTQPRLWDRADFDGENQPVIGITWYEASAFARYLTEVYQEHLPPGYVLRLPTEQEWEVAAAYDQLGQVRQYPWGNEPPTFEHAISALDRQDRVVPIGICHRGMAPCGAMDMAGNIWEWTATAIRGQTAMQFEAPGMSFSERSILDGINVPVKGGSYRSAFTQFRCNARRQYHPASDVDLGFRLVLAPKLP